MSKIKMVVIVGQTASGKSGLAMKLAQEYGGEIISADSRTVYRGLDIGTAKPSVKDMEKVKHHLIDVADWSENYTVANFKKMAEQALQEIKARGKLPLIVGGSGLYVDALLFDFSLGGQASQKLRRRLAGLSIEQLQRTIQEMGLNMPENSQNRRYLERTIERGEHKQTKQDIPPGVVIVGLKLAKEKLEARISARLEQMLEQGLLNEVEKAHKDYPQGSEALKGNAYRVFKSYLDGEISLEQAKQDFINSDLSLAKKQISWFKRNQSIVWFDSADKAYDYLVKAIGDEELYLVDGD